MGMKLRLGNFPRCSSKRRISIIFITVVLLIVKIIKMAILENEKCPENFAKRKIDELVRLLVSYFLCHQLCFTYFGVTHLYVVIGSLGKG